MSEAHDVLELARRLALEAGALQRSRYETTLEIDTKSADIDLVTEVDRACEALIIEALGRERPADAILAEEGGGRGSPDAEWRWVVDPLDGTVNFAHSYPCFCVSIGVEHRGERRVGVVYDPMRDELFEAVRGEGARRNGAPIEVSSESELGRAFVSTGFAYDVHHAERDNVAEFVRVLKRARAVRRDGSAAIDLCYVACGRFDGYWELKLNPWDVCAGLLIVEEAGGRTSDLDGNPTAGGGGQTVATNGPLHDALISALRG